MHQDIYYIIFEYSDFIDNIKICHINKDTYENLKIYDLININENIKLKLTQKVIEQKKYNKLKKLDASNNGKIRNVNHLCETLEELYCCSNMKASGICQSGLNDLKNIRILRASNNIKIYDASIFFNSLVELDCSKNCGINTNGVQKLKIKILNIKKNIKILSIDHLINVLELLNGKPFIKNNYLKEKNDNQLNYINNRFECLTEYKKINTQLKNEEIFIDHWNCEFGPLLEIFD